MRICEPYLRHKKNCRESMTVHYMFIVCVHASVCRCILPFMPCFSGVCCYQRKSQLVTTSKCMPSAVAGLHAFIYTKSYYGLVVLQ